MKHKIGDIIFVHDPRWWNLVSTSVMFCSSDNISPYKHKIAYHTAIVYDDYHLVESVWGHGVHKIMIDHYLRKPYITWSKRLIDDLWPDDPILTRVMLQNWLTKQIGRSYDRWQILAIAWRSGFRIIPPFYRWLKNNSSMLDSRYKFICSELIYQAYAEVFNVDLYPKASSSTITPFDIQRSELLEDV